VARLTSLIRLRLTGNLVTDLAPLFGLSRLRSALMRDNPLSDEAIAEQVPALDELGISVTF
jgi:Leucine-rich repeat (LRR) protein